MIEKLKQKFFNKKLIPTFIFLTCLGAFFFANPAVASVTANTVNPGDLNFSLDTYTQNAPGGGFQKDNLIQVAKTATDAQVQFMLTLNGPSSGIVLNSSQLNTGTNGGGSTIYSAGVGLVSIGQGTGAGALGCYNTYVFIFANVPNFNYFTCGFAAKLRTGSSPDIALVPNNNITAGTAIPLSLDIQLNDFNLNFNNTTTPQQIGIYPFITFLRENQAYDDVIATGTPVSFPLYFYVQLYDTPAQAQAAIAAGVRPNGVPSYSGASGSVSSSYGGSSNGILGLLTQVITYIVSLIEQVIYWLFSTVVTPIIVGIIQIHPYQDVFVSVIYSGWIAIRNVCDIFFIVALIIIAMATLFRVESYQFRHLLVQLIIAALLINFSLVICQAVLGIADTVQAQFLGQNATSVNNLASNLMLNAKNIVVGYSQNTSSTSNTGNALAGLVQPIFWLALSLGSFAVFCAIAIFLVIRVIALWILLMISPIAYVCGVLPATAHYRQEWWTTFLKYAFFTPIMAFFLNMAAVIFIGQQQNQVLQQILNSSAGFGSIASFVVSVGSYVLLLVFLVAGLMTAEKLGIYGAEGITSAAKKYGVFAPFTAVGGVAKLAGKVAKVGAERGFEGVQNMTGITMDPRIWAEKYKEYSEREKHKRLEKRADTDVGIGNFRIPGSAKIGLGSPLDFYKNYANWQGVKRMGRNLKMRTKNAFHNMEHAKEAVDDIRQQGNILTQPEFDNLERDAAAAESDYGKLLDQAKKLLSEKNGYERDLKAFEAQEAAGTLVDTDKQKMQSLRAKISEREKALAKMGASKFSEDDHGNEVLLEDFAQDTQLKEAQVQAKDLALKLQEDNGKLDSYRTKPGMSGYARQSLSDREALQKRLKEVSEAYKKTQGDYFSRRLPEAYHSRAARQSLESEEEKKVSDIKSWPEKVQVFLTAQAEQNPYLAAAVLKSLGKDSNFNEIVEALGYSSSSEGLKQLFEKEYRDKFNLTNHQMMQVATEMGYINEDAGWWNMARVSDIDKHGHLNWQIDVGGNSQWRRTVAAQVNKVDRGAVTPEQMSSISEKTLMDFKPEDITVRGISATDAYNQKWAPQNHEVSVEMEKRGARLIANFARTSFVNQTLGPEGHMTTGIHAAGKKVLQSMSKTHNTIYEFSRMLRPNTASAIASAKEWGWDYCKEAGIDREIYEKITKMAGKPVDPLT